MTTVTVAQLKARLSEYLRRVEAGESLTVVRHGAPVARLSPMGLGEDDPVVLDPISDPRGWARADLAPLHLDREIVEHLAEDRTGRDDLLDAEWR